MKLYCEIIKRCLTEAKNTIQTFIDSIVLFFFFIWLCTLCTAQTIHGYRCCYCCLQSFDARNFYIERHLTWSKLFHGFSSQTQHFRQVIGINKINLEWILDYRLTRIRFDRIALICYSWNETSTMRLIAHPNKSTARTFIFFSCAIVFFPAFVLGARCSAELSDCFLFVWPVASAISNGS